MKLQFKEWYKEQEKTLSFKEAGVDSAMQLIKKGTERLQATQTADILRALGEKPPPANAASGSVKPVSTDQAKGMPDPNDPKVKQTQEKLNQTLLDKMKKQLTNFYSKITNYVGSLTDNPNLKPPQASPK